MRAFYRHLRGVFVFGSFTLNTVFWFVPILVLAIVKLLLPLPALRRGITRLLMAMGETWVGLNSAILAKAGSVQPSPGV